MPIVSWEPTDLNSVFDPNEVEFSSGARHKELAEFSYLKGYWRFRDNLNDSKNSFNGTGTDVSVYSTLTGMPGKTLDFNGSSSKVLIPVLYSVAPSEFTISIWCRPDDLSSGRCLWENGNDGVYWLIVFNRAGTNARLISSYVNHDSSPAFVETSLGGASGLVGEVVHIYLTAKEGGNAYFYVNGVLIGTRACGNFLTVGNSHYIGCTRGGATQFFDGLVANPAIWEKQYDTTGEHCRSIYESEREIYQYALSTDIYPTTALAPAENVGYTSYTVTESGGGSTSHRLSPDDGTTNYAYAGGTWGVSDTGNADSVINTNISGYAHGYAAITPIVTLVSDGFTQHVFSGLEIGYTSNNAPYNNPGLDKPLSSHCAITTETAFKPFSDADVLDEDPGVYTLQSSSYRAETALGVEVIAATPILKGSFTSFKDAIRAMTIAAGTLPVGTYTFYLTVTDGGSPALSTTASLTVTIISPTSAFWDVQTSELTASGSIGKLLTDILDATISSRSSQVSVDAIPTNPVLTDDARLNNLDSPISATALEATLSDGVTNIRSDIAAIDIDTSTLAKEATLSQGVSNIQADIAGLPTNPLLADDVRLDSLANLDGTISDVLAAVTAVPTTEEILDRLYPYFLDINGLLGENSIQLASYSGKDMTQFVTSQYTDSSLSTVRRIWTRTVSYNDQKRISTTTKKRSS